MNLINIDMAVSFMILKAFLVRFIDLFSLVFASALKIWGICIVDLNITY